MANLELFLIFAFQCIIFTLAGSIQDKLIDRKIIKIVRFDPCHRTNLPYQFYIHISKCSWRAAFVTNATAIAKENLKDKLMLAVSIVRCRSRENLDSCEDYYEMRNLDFCQGLSEDFLLPGTTTPLSAPFEPKLSCPIKKGIYHAYNFTFNVAPFLMFEFEGWYWKTTIELFSAKENNKRVACSTLESYTQI